MTLGYMGIDYQHYVPAPDYSILIRDNFGAGTFHYWGPTRVTISLVYPIYLKKNKR